MRGAGKSGGAGGERGAEQPLGEREADAAFHGGLGIDLLLHVLQHAFNAQGNGKHGLGDEFRRGAGLAHRAGFQNQVGGEVLKAVGPQGKLRGIPGAEAVGVLAGGDEFRAGVGLAHGVREFPRAGGDSLQGGIADLEITPEFVAEFPEDFAGPAGFDILDPLHGFFHRAAAHVETNLRLGAGQAAETEELIGAEVVVFGLAPSLVQHADALVHGADSVAPMVAGSEVAAVALQRQVQGVGHLDGFGVEAVDVVGGVEQHLVDEDAGLVGCGNRKVDGFATGHLALGQFQCVFIALPTGGGEFDGSLGQHLVGTVAAAQGKFDALVATDGFGPDAAGVAEHAVDGRVDCLAGHRSACPAGP